MLIICLFKQNIWWVGIIDDGFPSKKKKMVCVTDQNPLVQKQNRLKPVKKCYLFMYA